MKKNCRPGLLIAGLIMVLPAQINTSETVKNSESSNIATVVTGFVTAQLTIDTLISAKSDINQSRYIFNNKVPNKNDIINPYIEAESGSLNPPLQVYSDTTASGGKYVMAPEGVNSTASAPATGQAVYTFSISTAGKYRVKCFVMAPSSSQNSYWVKMDIGEWVRWEPAIMARMEGLTNTWYWSYVLNGDVYDAEKVAPFMKYDLTEGVHTLVIAYREGGMKIDKIRIDPVRDYKAVQPGSAVDRAMGLFMGAYFGDAMGGPTENQHADFIKSYVDPLTTFIDFKKGFFPGPGGFIHKWAGSITDDSRIKEDLTNYYLSTLPPRNVIQFAEWLKTSCDFYGWWDVAKKAALNAISGSVAPEEYGLINIQGGGGGWWSPVGIMYAGKPRLAAAEAVNLCQIWKSPFERDMLAGVVAGHAESIREGATWQSVTAAIKDVCGPLAWQIYNRAESVANNSLKQGKDFRGFIQDCYNNLLTSSAPRANDALLSSINKAPTNYTTTSFSAIGFAEQQALALATFVYSQGDPYKASTIAAMMGRDCDSYGTNATAWACGLRGLSGCPEGWITILEDANIQDGDLLLLSEEIVTKSVKYTPSSDVIYSLNCGGGVYMSTNGIFFEADPNYNNYDVNVYQVVKGIKNTTDDVLYQSARTGNQNYKIPLANGKYEVTLKFAEISDTSAGSRVFNVLIEGKKVISGLDVYAEAGGNNTAYDKTMIISVTDGSLEIDMVPIKGKPIISAILVKKRFDIIR
jgi:ADP-ribosylglycohydrolase